MLRSNSKSLRESCIVSPEEEKERLQWGKCWTNRLDDFPHYLPAENFVPICHTRHEVLPTRSHDAFTSPAVVYIGWQ